MTLNEVCPINLQKQGRFTQCRRGHVHDIGFLTEALLAIHPGTYLPRHETLRQAIYSEEYLLYVLQVDGDKRMIGLVKADGEEALITAFYRSPFSNPFTVQAEAAQLLAFCSQDLKRRGVKYLGCYVSTELKYRKLIRFYQRLGFGAPDMVRLLKEI